MYFWKIDDETIRCLINKQEIDQMGFNIQDLSTSEESMSSFLNAIVDSSLHYITWNTEHGVQNYIARALPADQFLFTISCTYQDDAINRDLRQIQKMTAALNSKITKERLDRIYDMNGDEKEKAFGELTKDLHDVCSGKLSNEQSESEPVASDQVPVYQIPNQTVVFDNFDDLTKFCTYIGEDMMFPSTLYKLDDEYIMVVGLSECKDENKAMSFILIAEECNGICDNIVYEDAYLREHGSVLIEKDSLKLLHSL